MPVERWLSALLVRERDGCDNARMRSDGGSRSRSTSDSILSIGSSGSILSIGSSGSILSIGSSGSILSIGSAGSFASALSVGSFLSVGSVLSGLSRWSLLSWRAAGAVKSARRGKAGGPRLSKTFRLPKTLQPSNGFGRRGESR